MPASKLMTENEAKLFLKFSNAMGRALRLIPKLGYPINRDELPKEVTRLSNLLQMKMPAEARRCVYIAMTRYMQADAENDHPARLMIAQAAAALKRGTLIVKKVRFYAEPPPRRKSAKVTRRPVSASAVYKVGYQHAQEAFGEHGRSAVSPSVTERQDYRGDWAEFMRGWRAGMRDAERE